MKKPRLALALPASECPRSALAAPASECLLNSVLRVYYRVISLTISLVSGPAQQAAQLLLLPGILEIPGNTSASYVGRNLSGLKPAKPVKQLPLCVGYTYVAAPAKFRFTDNLTQKKQVIPSQILEEYNLFYAEPNSAIALN